MKEVIQQVIQEVSIELVSNGGCSFCCFDGLNIPRCGSTISKLTGLDCSPSGFNYRKKPLWVQATADNVKVGSTVRFKDSHVNRKVHATQLNDVCVDAVNVRNETIGLTVLPYRGLEVLA